MGVRGQPTKWDKWYSTARWGRIRRHQLREHPLCGFCLERGIVTAAEICDHVDPHHGDVNKFWLGPFQSLFGQGSAIPVLSPVRRTGVVTLGQGPKSSRGDGKADAPGGRG